MRISVDWWISELKTLGAKDVDQYETKLRSFGQNEKKVLEFIAEARAAKLFLTNGIGVTMQDRPDLKLDFYGEIIYAEVKHYHEKETDRRDEVAMRAAPFQVMQVGNVIDDEGQHGYQGMCATAIKKEPQYVDDFPNILVFVNHSSSLDLHLRSAVNEYNDAVQRVGAQSPLRKLGGMMMLGANQSFGNGPNNVEFCYTWYALKPINPYFVQRMSQRQVA